MYRISYTASAPSITTHPSSQTVAPGASVTFSVRASGPPPLQYQWQRNGVNISGATAQDYTIVAAAGDNGARFRAIVSNANGNVLSNEAILTVTANQPPTGTITQPVAGSLYSGAQRHQLRGNRDRSRGRNAWSELPSPGESISITTRTRTRSSQRRRGATSGSFTVPTTGHTETNVWYRIFLIVRDSAGATQTSSGTCFHAR